MDKFVKYFEKKIIKYNEHEFDVSGYIKNISEFLNKYFVDESILDFSNEKEYVVICLFKYITNSEIFEHNLDEIIEILNFFYRFSFKKYFEDFYLNNIKYHIKICEKLDYIRFDDNFVLELKEILNPNELIEYDVKENYDILFRICIFDLELILENIYHHKKIYNDKFEYLFNNIDKLLIFEDEYEDIYKNEDDYKNNKNYEIYDKYIKCKNIYALIAIIQDDEQKFRYLKNRFISLLKYNDKYENILITLKPFYTDESF